LASDSVAALADGLDYRRVTELGAARRRPPARGPRRPWRAGHRGL